MLIIGQRQLEAALSGDVAHYHQHRPHRSPGQAPPLAATPLPVSPASIRVPRLDRVGGLIHESAQVA
jgi:putative transposase